MHYMNEDLVRLRHRELLCEAKRQRLAAKAGRASLGRSPGVERIHWFRPADALRAVFGRG